MKSYKSTLNAIRSEITTLKKHIEVMKKHPPMKLYLLWGATILLPRQYVQCLDTWRNKIIFNVIASDDWDVPTIHKMTLGEFLVEKKHRAKLVPLKIKDLPLYVHFKYKTPLFERIIKTGKLPRR